MESWNNYVNKLFLPGELQLIRKLKVYETTQDPSQFTKITKLPAVPLTCMGKICNVKTSIRTLLEFSYQTPSTGKGKKECS